MSKLIPSLVCTTPPPIDCSDLEQTEHDEFGDFATADDAIYGCDSYSLKDSLKKMPQVGVADCMGVRVGKDFQDKRKELLPPVACEGTNGYALDDEDADVERPPALLFDDADKADASESPTNFSISFDDHVLDDGEDGSVEDDLQLELPDHDAEAPRADVNEIDDDDNASNASFEDFADFSSALPEPAADDDDDFDDFADYTSSSVITPAATVSTDPKIRLLDAQNAFVEAEIIFKQMFALSGEVDACLEHVDVDFTAANAVFTQIQDVTETNALSYQWGKSQVQQDMLKALNIDTRNILYAHGASKADILMPTIVNPSCESVEDSKQPPAVAIPSAQFDWGEAGLANPFDSSLCLSANASAPPDTFMSLVPLQPALKSAHPAAPESASTLALDDWDLWLQSVAKDQEDQGKPAGGKDIKDPVSKMSVDTESVQSLQFAELISDQVDPEADDSDLRLPPSEEDAVATRLAPEGRAQDEFSDFTAFQRVPGLPVEEDTSWPVSLVPLRETYIDELPDDDFQDFQCGAQISLNAESGALGSVLTPTLLQPVKMQPQTEIRWPAPGISDEELARFDAYVRSEQSPDAVTRLSGPAGELMVEKSVVVPASKVILPFNEVLLPPNNQVVISKDLVLPILEGSPRKYAPAGPKAHAAPDDDVDWSEFVSSATAPPARANELPLSIPQLRSIQASKPPIPVITARGLVQTKIPTLAPGTPTKCLAHVPLRVTPPTDGYQPATISAQFAAQLQQSCAPPPHDDDEWSDFMSSRPPPPPPPVANGVAPWTHNHLDMPNIIMNPVHIRSYGQKGKECKDTNGMLHYNAPKLPDLDFIAPKAKVCSHAKK